MAGGRPRTPDTLKVAKGTFKPSRSNLDQPKVAPGMPEIPAGLTGIAKKKFIELAKELVQMKVITPHDRHVLEQVAKEFALFKEMEKVIKKDGLFYHSTVTEKTEEIMPDGESVVKTKVKVTQNRVRTHPALTARNQCWANIMKGLQECGLTPSTRGKLKVIKKEETNPFAALLSGS
jgi:P27 family predicted phage terminase small subunit